MKQKASYYGTVQDGKMPFMSFAKPFIKALEGKKVKVTIEECQRTRSTSQNAYYWGVVVPAVQELIRSIGTPLDADETHELIQRYILKKTRKVEIKGKLITLRQSSTRATTAEWEEDMQIIRAWCAEKGVFIPLPE